MHFTLNHVNCSRQKANKPKASNNGAPYREINTKSGTLAPNKNEESAGLDETEESANAVEEDILVVDVHDNINTVGKTNKRSMGRNV